MSKLESGGIYDYPARVDRNIARFVLDMEVDLKSAIGVTILAVVAIYMPFLGETIVRTVLALVAVAIVPGYVLIAAMFPGKDDIDALERAVLSLGVGVIVVPLLALGLNFTEWGVRLDPLTACIATFSIGLALVASKRRFDLPEENRFAVLPRELGKSAAGMVFPQGARAADKALNVILVLALLLSAGTISYVVMFPKQGEQFSEFYILGPGGKAENYTVNYRLGDTGRFVVGVANHEQREVNYNLLVLLHDDDMPGKLFSDSVTLADNGTLERPVDLQPGRSGTGMKLEFLLYTDADATVPYRECHVWINVTAPKYTNKTANLTPPNATMVTLR